ncbi:MAG: hypothetical protein ACP5DC_06655 [Halothiobacillaceae bacterium]
MTPEHTATHTPSVPAAGKKSSWRGLVLGAVVSACIFLLALAGWYSLSQLHAPGQAFPLGSMKAERGQLAPVDEGLRITSTQGDEVLLSMNFGQPADMTRFGRMRLESDQPLARATLLWMSAGAPGRVQEAGFDASGHLDLTALPDWTGQPTALGLRLQGEDLPGVTLQALALLPPEKSPAAFLADLSNQLQQRSEIGHQSINTWIINAQDAPSPQVFLALAALSTLAGFGIAARFRPGPPILLPAMVILGLGWALLDYRWHSTLLEAHADSVDRYGDVAPSELRAAAPQGELVPWVQAVSKTLDPSERVLVFSQQEFFRLKTRYLLSPLNAIGVLEPADAAAHLRAGDQLLLVGAHPAIRVSADGRRISLLGPSGQARQFDVRPLHVDRQGGAFRVLKENSAP